MKKIYSILLLLVLLASCNVLDQESPNDITNDKVSTTKEGAEAALIGLYSSMQSRDYYGGYYPMIADLYSDVGVDGGFDNVALDEISILDVTPSNIISENTWLAIYYTIATANNIIEGVEKVKDPDFDDDTKNNIKGQALAIRALAHFDALRLYGEHWDLASDFGIPVVTKVQTAFDVVARGKVSDAYDAIIKDLTDASTMITEDSRDAAYINPVAVKALLARAYLYQGDYANAASTATEVIDEGTFELLDSDNFTSIYTSKLSSESLFELVFDVQNRSAFNSITYSRTDALRTEVLFLVEEGISQFFADRPGDLRASLVDFENNDASISPDGRSQKYRGEESRDNSAYIIRIAEMYLIRAEANGVDGGGLGDLNILRANRGLDDVDLGVDTDEEFLNAVLDERKAELNFEGHRMFDLARTGKINEVLDIDEYKSIFPIPYRETIATKGVVKQNPGYE